MEDKVRFVLGKDAAVELNKGDVVAYLEGEVEGAIPNGTRVRKTCFEKGDSTPEGVEGVVLSSLQLPNQIAYFVAWDYAPHLPMGIQEYKIETVN